MQLSLPEKYVADPGRKLTSEEIAEIAKTVTPVHLIVSKTCKRESTNDFYARYYRGRG